MCNRLFCNEYLVGQKLVIRPGRDTSLSPSDTSSFSFSSAEFLFGLDLIIEETSDTIASVSLSSELLFMLS